jgi:hypothetical protein
MGRFNWMWKAVQRPDSSWAGNQLKRIALIAASLLLSTHAATALSSDDDADMLFSGNDDCLGERYSHGSFGSAYITLTWPGGIQVSGGSYWDSRVKDDWMPAITEAAMVACFNDYTVRSLVQRGADAASFDDQNLMGFGYLSSVSGQWVEYSLGSGTLQPIPKIDSATYNAPTGELQVTGQNLKAAAGAMNDIKANKLSLTGEGGATYALTDTSDVEISSSTQFTITLSVTDKVNLRELLNKNGSTSSDLPQSNACATWQRSWD